MNAGALPCCARWPGSHTSDCPSQERGEHVSLGMSGPVDPVVTVSPSGRVRKHRDPEPGEVDPATYRHAPVLVALLRLADIDAHQEALP